MHCPECDRPFKDKRAYEQHVLDSPKHLGRNSCVQCGRAFGSQAALQQHSRDLHEHVAARTPHFTASDRKDSPQKPLLDPSSQTTAFSCKKYGRSFASKESLTQHLRDSAAHKAAKEAFSGYFFAASDSTVSVDEEPSGSWSMHPNLHYLVMRQLKAVNLRFRFHANDDPGRGAQEYNTSVMGKFDCFNASCRQNGWSSKQIAVTIRMYPNARYNARVYHQRCASCNHLGRLSLDEDTYVERVAYRLKKWSGIDVVAPQYSGQSKKPHETDLCEGCRLGCCSQL